MSAIFTHDVGERRWQMCLCTGCGCVGIEGAGQHFEALEPGGLLFCPWCFEAAMWDALIAHDGAWMHFWHEGVPLPCRCVFDLRDAPPVPRAPFSDDDDAPASGPQTRTS